MYTIQYLQRIRPISGLLSLGLLAACGGSGSPLTATANPNTNNTDPQDVSLDDACAPVKSPFASVIDYANCMGAALGAPQSGEAGDSSSFKLASRTRP
jgi:hypothetical protein